MLTAQDQKSHPLHGRSKAARSCACGILNPCSRYPRSAQGHAHPFGSWSGSRSRRSRHYSHSLNSRHGSPIELFGLCCLQICLVAEYIRLKATLPRHSDIRLMKGISALGFYHMWNKWEANGMTRVSGPLTHRISSCGFVSVQSTVSLRLGHLLHGRWSTLLRSVWPTITAATMSTRLLNYRCFNVFEVKKRQPGR